MKYCYFFGKEKGKDGKNLTEGNKDMKDLLGGKGANLAEMASIGIRIPPGFTISTEACAEFDKTGKIPEECQKQIDESLALLEKTTEAKLGDPSKLLLVSVRSGAAISMPGMMDTILNLGLNDQSVVEFSKQGLPRSAWDSYRRLLQMFGDIVMEVPHSKFEKVLTAEKAAAGVTLDKDLSAEQLQNVVKGYKALIKETTGKEFPQNPREQLQMAILAVFQSWNNSRAIHYRKMNRITGLKGTAVNVQAMVFGNKNEKSGTGVAFSRSPSTGENVFYGEFLANAQGEDVVAGIRTPKTIDQMKQDFPEAYEELCAVYHQLEQHYHDMQDLEFTVQDEILYMLQCRNAKRTAQAAVKIAVDMCKEGLIDKKTAIMRVSPDQLDHLLHPALDPAALKNAKLLAKGLAASPGASCGRIAFNNQQAVEYKKQGLVSILVRNETSPEDLIGMEAASGILTAHGGRTSHAAVVARTMGKTCVCGCTDAEINDEEEVMVIKGQKFHKGDVITVDGTEGRVFQGEVKTVPPTFSEELKELMGWEKEFRTLGVRTNADTPKDAAKAIEYGAEGIGLCRTEHMFFEKTRINDMRQMILASDLEGRKQALTKLKPHQKADFIGMFEIMGDRPMTVRLLDPPLHEFLPQNQEDFEKISKEMNVPIEVLKQKADELHEQNPMLGHRGCRLGISYPEITVMQAEAIFEAAKEVHAKGIHVQPEVMIPLIIGIEEFVHQRDLIRDAAERILGKDSPIHYKIGTMIETPRAAIMSGMIAKEAEFFSFGSNDLTQMTLGFSRDDSNIFINRYLDLGLLKESPFNEIDRDGVGFLIKKAVHDGRETRPTLKVGLCGEHGGNPASVEFLNSIPLTYTSCSPYRVPIARLAAAQAAIKLAKK